MTAASATSARGGRGHRAWGLARSLANRAARSLFSVALTFLGLTCVTFFIGRVIPIDPVLAIVGDKASAETYARVRAKVEGGGGGMPAFGGQLSPQQIKDVAAFVSTSAGAP